MDDWLNDIVRGYTDEQLNEAMLFTLVNFLRAKGLIDFKEFLEYYEINLNGVLKSIITRDKESMLINKNKNEDNVDK